MGTPGLHDVFNAGFAILMLEELLLPKIGDPDIVP